MNPPSAKSVNANREEGILLFYQCLVHADPGISEWNPHCGDIQGESASRSPLRIDSKSKTAKCLPAAAEWAVE